MNVLKFKYNKKFKCKNLILQMLKKYFFYLTLKTKLN